MKDPMDWRWDALCAQTDAEAFFPEMGGSNRAAKKICAACPVVRKCLEDALESNQTVGILGGLSPSERAKLRKERAA